ncbi:MAG: FMN-binding protein [Elusimicrobia bacterium]|nr:FMN-binding protein [Elusimicrobiota bacterium]
MKIRIRYTGVIAVIFVLVTARLLVLIEREGAEDNGTRAVTVFHESYDEGLFRGRGEGFAGEIVVEVLFEKKTSTSSVSMKNINIVKSEEVDKYWVPVMGSVIREVLLKQSTDNIDTVTGATQSSEGLLKAIENARKKAYKRY